MVRRLSVREARAHFSEVLGGVFHTGEPVAIERNGKTVAYVVSPERFLGLPTEPSPPTLEEIMALRGFAGRLAEQLSTKQMRDVAQHDRLTRKIGRG